MKALDRKLEQQRRDDALRSRTKGAYGITKRDSLLERARKLGLATDAPTTNRASRRRDLRKAVSHTLKEKKDAKRD